MGIFDSLLPPGFAESMKPVVGSMRATELAALATVADILIRRSPLTGSVASLGSTAPLGGREAGFRLLAHVERIVRAEIFLEVEKDVTNAQPSAPVSSR